MHHLVSCLRIGLVLRETHTDACMNVDGFLIEGYDNLLRAIETHVLTLDCRPFLGNVVQTEHHVL